ncbi:MAG: type II toxin-antitoxin system VapC family toxin [Nitrospira sp.]|nr:type II toxin-antitoxin system VapC family toxin [Nitrospira sp.]MBH0183311.1 type II toxin-antitoxin system VapC family toxin [Nitrospira sp.]MBH0187190.1 type II toxin-antitoxin system VapC family toxin [Nitrospira sp.]
MAKVSVLVDTDIFIDYFNTGRFHALFDPSRFILYYSVITKKELLSKPGLRDSERASILAELAQCRLIALSDSITTRYSALRHRHPSLEKGDALIAATALVKHLPLMTRNKRHFQIVPGLTLFGE